MAQEWCNYVVNFVVLPAWYPDIASECFPTCLGANCFTLWVMRLKGEEILHC